MSKLRFNPGQRVVVNNNPRNNKIFVGWAGTIRFLGAFGTGTQTTRDYAVDLDGWESPTGYWAMDDDQLEPLNPPKEDDVDNTVDPEWKKLKDQLQITADLVKEKRRKKA